MKVTGADPAQAYPDPAFPVLAWPEHLPPPPLPAGHGGIAVRSRSGSSWVAPYGTPVRNIGIDDQVLWHGWGRMVAVVPPGEHVVEVRGERVEAVRSVTVAAGELVELEYAAPRGYAKTGVLAEPPARDVGAGLRPTLLWAAVFIVLAARITPRIGEPTHGGSRWLTAGLVALAVAVAVLVRAGRRRGDVRYRRNTAQPPHYVDARHPLAGGYLLGGTVRELPGAAAGQGGLLVITDLRHDLWLAGRREARHARAWIAPPRLLIDEVPRTVSWSTWWFPLDVGRHTITVGLPESEDLGGATPSRRGSGAPVTVHVDIAEGATRTVMVRARTRIDVSLPRSHGELGADTRLGARTHGTASPSEPAMSSEFTGLLDVRPGPDAPPVSHG